MKFLAKHIHIAIDANRKAATESNPNQSMKIEIMALISPTIMQLATTFLGVNQLWSSYSFALLSLLSIIYTTTAFTPKSSSLSSIMNIPVAYNPYYSYHYYYDVSQK